VIVVLDTNVLHRDVYAERSQMQQIFTAAEAGKFEVVVPRVMVEELVRQYPERLRELIKTTKKNIKDTKLDLQSFGFDVPKVPEVDVDAAIGDYRERLENRLNGNGRRIAENPADAARPRSGAHSVGRRSRRTAPASRTR